MQRNSAQTPWATIRHTIDRAIDGRQENSARFGPAECGKALLNQSNSPLVNRTVRHLVNHLGGLAIQKGA